MSSALEKDVKGLMPTDVLELRISEFVPDDNILPLS